LRPSHVTEIDQGIKNSGFALATKTYKANCLRQILRWLWQEHGAPKLDGGTTKYAGLRPRNVTVTEEERSLILEAAPDYLKLWILLCADLALRSGTALIIGPEHYDPARQTLRFVTKKGARQTMPTTDEIDELVAKCNMSHQASFVRQLHLSEPHTAGRPLDPTAIRDDQLDHAWRELVSAVGITRRIVPHDLRRTAAVAMLEETGDVRDVQALLGHRSLQSTIWYLDHDLRPVKRETLERIKRPFIVRKERTA
jgi:integrase